jgi:hypothetical protein
MGHTIITVHVICAPETASSTKKKTYSSAMDMLLVYDFKNILKVSSNILNG